MNTVNTASVMPKIISNSTVLAKRFLLSPFRGYLSGLSGYARELSEHIYARRVSRFDIDHYVQLGTGDQAFKILCEHGILDPNGALSKSALSLSPKGLDKAIKIAWSANPVFHQIVDDPDWLFKDLFRLSRPDQVQMQCDVIGGQNLDSKTGLIFPMPAGIRSAMLNNSIKRFTVQAQADVPNAEFLRGIKAGLRFIATTKVAPWEHIFIPLRSAVSRLNGRPEPVFLHIVASREDEPVNLEVSIYHI